MLSPNHITAVIGLHPGARITHGLISWLIRMLAGGGGLVTMWYLSGLGGAPRRYALLPPGFEIHSLIASLSVVVLGVGLLLFTCGLVNAFWPRRP